MTADWAIITGGGTGIGRALAHRLADDGLQILIVGRRKDPLRETCTYAPERIHGVPADVASEQGRERVAAALPVDARLRCLVHNAGVLSPVGPLADVTLAQWRQSQAINVEAPLFLSQLLLPRLGGGRILHISSGAAHHGYRGWGAYCTSKAALHMLYQVLREELKEQGVEVGSIRPGVVDTPMQGLIREQTAERFPAVERFIQLKRQGALIDPTAVAGFMSWLLLQVSAEEYRAAEWDFTDPQQRARWESA